MATAAQIRDRLASWLAGHISLEDLNEWLAAYTWNIHQSGDREAETLAYAIELRLAEHSAGHLATGELRSELLRFARHGPSITVADSPFVWKSAATSSAVGSITKTAAYPLAYPTPKIQIGPVAR